MTESTEPIKNPNTIVEPPLEQSEAAVKPEIKTGYEKYKKRFLAEKILPCAEAYDYSTFLDNDFFAHLKKIRESYNEDDDIYNIDIFSFDNSELSELWNLMDKQLRKRREELERTVGLEQASLFADGKYKYSPDGRIIPTVKNPCVIGGVHGDEVTIVRDMEKALASLRAPLLGLDKERGYSNWQVNKAALVEGVRAFSVAKQESDTAADMNRPVIEDQATQRVKEEILSQIANFDSPFLLDCHNDNSVTYESDSEKRQPLAYISEAGDVVHKVKMAMELGLHRVIIIPPIAMSGSMTESLRAKKENSDGITIETRGDDEEGTSTLIALKFLQLTEVINNGRPSNGVQILHEFQTEFLNRNPDIKIFQMEIITEEDLGSDPEAHYTVIDGTPIRITALKMEGDSFTPIAFAESDKKLF